MAGREPRALVLLALEEAAVNVFEHGYAGMSGQPLVVAFRPGRNGGFEIVLRDRAPLVDVSRIAPGDLKELARRHASRGRGLALIRLFTQTVRHRPRRGGGNELVLEFDPERLRRILEERVLPRPDSR